MVLDTIICVGLVVFFAARRYSVGLKDSEFEPPVSSTTTILRYYLSWFAYIAWSMLLLFLLSNTPLFTRVLGVDPKAIDGVTGLPAMFGAALVLTSLMPSIEKLRLIDEYIRARLYEAALIPVHARVLTAQLIQCRIGGAITAAERVQAILAGLDALPQDRSSRALSEHLATDANTNAMNEIRAQTDPPPLRQLCRILSRAVLATQFTERSRITLLQRIGFRIDRASEPEASGAAFIGQVFLVAMLMMMVVLSLFSESAPSSDQSFSHVVSIAMMVAAMYSASVLCARQLTPEEVGGAAPHGGRWHRYVFAGFLSAVLGLLITWCFKWFAQPALYVAASLEAALDQTLARAPYACVMGACGISVAWALDRARAVQTPTRWERVKEVVVVAVANGAGALLASRFLVGEASRPWYMLVPTSLAIGVVIGLAAPQTRRSVVRARKAGSPLSLDPVSRGEICITTGVGTTLQSPSALQPPPPCSARRFSRMFHESFLSNQILSDIRSSWGWNPGRFHANVLGSVLVPSTLDRPRSDADASSGPVQAAV